MKQDTVTTLVIVAGAVVWTAVGWTAKTVYDEYNKPYVMWLTDNEPFASHIPTNGVKRGICMGFEDGGKVKWRWEPVTKTGK